MIHESPASDRNEQEEGETLRVLLSDTKQTHHFLTETQNKTEPFVFVSRKGENKGKEGRDSPGLVLLKESDQQERQASFPFMMISIIICWSLRLIWSVFWRKIAVHHWLLRIPCQSDRKSLLLSLDSHKHDSALLLCLTGFLNNCQVLSVLPVMRESCSFPSLRAAINQWWHRASFFLSSQTTLHERKVCASTDSRCSLIIHSSISCLLKSFLFLWMVSVSLMLHPHLNFLLLGKERKILRIIALLVLDSEFDLLLFSWEWQVKY